MTEYNYDYGVFCELELGRKSRDKFYISSFCKGNVDILFVVINEDVFLPKPSMTHPLLLGSKVQVEIVI